MDELVKKQLILKPINKNRIKYANFDFGLEDYREMYHIIEKEIMKNNHELRSSF